MSSEARNAAVKDLFSKSASDLESAKLLYDHKHFANCLYFLQQSGEKLAKGLWLSFGFLTPTQAREDRIVKIIMGFEPKEPRAYGHKILPHLVSDVERMIPSVQQYFEFFENSELGPRASEFLVYLHGTRRNVQKLKKRPFSPVGSAEQLEKEITAAQAILESLEPRARKMNEELEKLDSSEIAHVTTFLEHKLGIRVRTDQLPSLDKIKADIVPMFRIVMLALLSAAIASLLDPLESVTRYPDKSHIPFDENHPYIKNFMGLHDIIACILQKSIFEG